MPCDAIVVAGGMSQTAAQGFATRDTVNGPRPLEIAFDDDDPRALLETLPARGILSVLIEDGPSIAGAFLAAGLVDHINSERHRRVSGPARDRRGAPPRA